MSLPIHVLHSRRVRTSTRHRSVNRTVLLLLLVIERFAYPNIMGKKSKKGVSRAGTKKHNAAGHGKSAASAPASLKGRIRSDSKASFESGGSNNAFNVHDTGMAQNFTVSAKEQPPPSFSNLGTDSDIHTILDMLNKENNAAPGQTMQTMMADVEKILISPPRVKKATDSAKEETSMDAPVISLPIDVSSSIQDAAVALEVVETELFEKSEKTSAPSLEKGEVVEAPTVENVVEIKPSPVEKPVVSEPSVQPPAVLAPAAAPDSAEVDDQPLFCVSDSPVDADAEMEPTKEIETPSVPVPAAKLKAQEKPDDAMNVWSSKLRDAVSLIDTDEMANQPPVLDVTPVKQPSKLIVPLIQTVSPSPDTSKRLPPPPTLDTPDAKDAETVKQNECGCIIV
jgi:hypothetical protein